MQFFKDFYKYDDIIEAPEYGSTEYEQENKRVEILGKQYDDYLKGIKKHLPRNFFVRFSAWSSRIPTKDAAPPGWEARLLSDAD